MTNLNATEIIDHQEIQDEISPQLILIRGPIGVGKSTTMGLLRERMQPASIVDFDAFKRQIDTTVSSTWRRQTALKTALYMTEELMLANRKIIVDIHSSSHEQYDQYHSLADKFDYPVISYLLSAPLKTCLQRAKDRFVPGLHYPIDEIMIRQYHEGTFQIPGETIFDTSILGPDIIVNSIFKEISQGEHRPGV